MQPVWVICGDREWNNAFNNGIKHKRECRAFSSTSSTFIYYFCTTETEMKIWRFGTWSTFPISGPSTAPVQYYTNILTNNTAGKNNQWRTKLILQIVPQLWASVYPKETKALLLLTIHIACSCGLWFYSLRFLFIYLVPEMCGLNSIQQAGLWTVPTNCESQSTS